MAKRTTKKPSEAKAEQETDVPRPVPIVVHDGFDDGGGYTVHVRPGGRIEVSNGHEAIGMHPSQALRMLLALEQLRDQGLLE